MTVASAGSAGRFAEPAAVRHVRAALRAAGRSTASALLSRRAVPRWTIAVAGLSPILLVGAWAIAGSLQPSSYSPVRQTVSVLAGYAATDRWIVAGAVLVVGVAYIATALGLTGLRTSARLVLVLAGVSGIGIAASPEPAHGSTPQHLAWTVVGAVAISIWPAFVAQRRARRPRPLVLNVTASAAVTTVFLALLVWVVIETGGGSFLGLAERITTTAEMTWPLVVALALRRSQPA